MSTTIEILDNSGVAVEVAIATPGPKGDPSAGAYIAAIDTGTDALASATVAQQVQIGTAVEGDGITLVDNALRFAEAGVYSITWSIQFASTGNAVHWAEVWHKLNGGDLANSGSRFDVPAVKSNVPGHAVGTVNLVLTIAANDELELWWVGQATTLSIQTFGPGTNPTRPAVPGIIITAQQIR